MLGTSLRPDGFVIKLGISLEQGVQGQLGINGFKTCTISFSVTILLFFKLADLSAWVYGEDTVSSF